MPDKFWYLKNCSLFERLTQSQIARLESRSVSRQFNRNSIIYVPTDRSDSVLLMAAGRVKIYYNTSDGKQALLAFIEPGELFGELALFDDGQREEFAEAMEKSTIVLIPREEIHRLMYEHSEISLGVTKLMGLRRRRVEQRLRSLLFRSNRERVIHLLVQLAEDYGARTRDGIELRIKLSHQDLASIIGSTRETVTVVLGDLQDDGLLSIKRRQITVLKPERLAASISVPPPQVAEFTELKRRRLRQPQFET